MMQYTDSNFNWDAFERDIIDLDPYWEWEQENDWAGLAETERAFDPDDTEN